jgi:hypothetical protein
LGPPQKGLRDETDRPGPVKRKRIKKANGKREIRTEGFGAEGDENRQMDAQTCALRRLLPYLLKSNDVFAKLEQISN